MNVWFLLQAWFRNTWSWNHSKRPSMTYVTDERRIEIVSHLSCLMYFDVVFALNGQRYLILCKIYSDPCFRCDFVMFHAHFRWVTRWGVHCLGARHEKLGTYNLYVEENTEAAWPWLLSLLSPGQYQVIQNISIDKLISTLDVVNWHNYIKNWYHHSEWLAFGVGFFVSIPRGDLLWERYAWRPCRWGCLEPLPGDLAVAKCVFYFPFWHCTVEVSQGIRANDAHRGAHTVLYSNLPFGTRPDLWNSYEIWIMKITLNSKLRKAVLLIVSSFPVFSGEMWWLSKFGTSCVARHSQSFWDSLGTKAWSRNLGCSMSRDANMPEIDDLLWTQLWFCGQLEWWRMIYFTWHKRIILEI